MFIKTIALKNYRNYKHLNLSLSQGINVFYGDNAQGKTNILEAIYLCATSKSHRTNKDKELIFFEKDEAHIKLIIDKKQVEHKIDVHLKKNKKKGIAINGLPIFRISDLFGLVNVVIFSPEDLTLIKEGPKQRRRFIDLELCQLNPLYYYHLQQYYKVLKQRNNLLKQMYVRDVEFKEMIKVWDDQLVEYGIKIIEQRSIFIDKLNDIIFDLHKNLTGKKEKLVLKYEQNVAIDQFKQKLEGAYQKDLKTKTTNDGPHRDDISFLINEIDVRKYGSQGQQRTAALSLKLAEIELVKQLINDQPILLLDDVLSELDMNRQKYLLSTITTTQTIITCTGIEDILNKDIHIEKKFKVKDGEIL